MKKPIVNIEQWEIVPASDCWPGTEGEVLRGIGENHPQSTKRFDAITHTSLIVHKSLPTMVETRNTIYMLGEPKAAPLPINARRAIDVLAPLLCESIDDPQSEALLAAMGMPAQFVREQSRKKAEQQVRALVDAGLLVVA